MIARLLRYLRAHIEPCCKVVPPLDPYTVNSAEILTMARILFPIVANQASKRPRLHAVIATNDNGPLEAWQG